MHSHLGNVDDSSGSPHTGSSMSWAIRGNAWTRLNVSDSQLTPFLNGERADAYQPMRDLEATVVTMEGIAAEMAAFLLKKSAGR